MENGTAQNKNTGFMSFLYCYFCGFTVCRRFTVPREVIGNMCPVCESEYSYRRPPIFKSQTRVVVTFFPVGVDTFCVRALLNP